MFDYFSHILPSTYQIMWQVQLLYFRYKRAESHCVWFTVHHHTHNIDNPQLIKLTTKSKQLLVILQNFLSYKIHFNAYWCSKKNLPSILSCYAFIRLKAITLCIHKHAMHKSAIEYSIYIRYTGIHDRQIPVHVLPISVLFCWWLCWKRTLSLTVPFLIF